MATRTEQDIIQRIAKLLERANHSGTGEHEAAACAAMAQKLLLEHGLEVSRVKNATGEKKSKDTTHSRIKMGVGKTIGYDWCLTFAHSVARNTGCAYLMYESTRELIFIGSPTDIQVAISLYTFLVDQSIRICKQRWDATGPVEKANRFEGLFRKFRYPFMLGCSQRVADRMDAEYREIVQKHDDDREKVSVDGQLVGAATALVVAKKDDNDEYIFRTWGVDLTPDSRFRKAVFLQRGGTEEQWEKRFDHFHQASGSSAKVRKERPRKQVEIDWGAYEQGRAAGNTVELSQNKRLG